MNYFTFSKIKYLAMHTYYNLENVISWLCEYFPYLRVVTSLSSFTTKFIPEHLCCQAVVTTKTEMAKMMTLRDASLDRISEVF